MLGEATLYVSAQRLFTTLRAARGDGTYERQLGRFLAPNLLYSHFGDALLAAAAMDRLLHHAELVTLDGRSYRTAKRSHSPGPGLSPDGPQSTQ